MVGEGCSCEKDLRLVGGGLKKGQVEREAVYNKQFMRGAIKIAN